MQAGSLMRRDSQENMDKSGAVLIPFTVPVLSPRGSISGKLTCTMPTLEINYHFACDFGQS